MTLNPEPSTTSARLSEAEQREATALDQLQATEAALTQAHDSDLTGPQLRDLQDQVAAATHQLQTAQAALLDAQSAHDQADDDQTAHDQADDNQDDENQTDDLTGQFEGTRDLEDGEVGEQQPVDLAYPDAVSWLEGYLVQIWRHGADGNWCRYWWRHAEAVTIIEALWRTWEHLRTEGPTGMAVWLRDYLNPLMHQLTAKTGTFADCRAQTSEHRARPILITEPPPL